MPDAPPSKQYRWTLTLTDERYGNTLAVAIRTFGEPNEAPLKLEEACDTVTRTLKVRSDAFRHLYDALWVPELWDTDKQEDVA